MEFEENHVKVRVCSGANRVRHLTQLSHLQTPQKAAKGRTKPLQYERRILSNWQPSSSSCRIRPRGHRQVCTTAFVRTVRITYIREVSNGTGHEERLEGKQHNKDQEPTLRSTQTQRKNTNKKRKDKPGGPCLPWTQATVAHNSGMMNKLTSHPHHARILKVRSCHSATNEAVIHGTQ